MLTEKQISFTALGLAVATMLFQIFAVVKPNWASRRDPRYMTVQLQDQDQHEEEDQPEVPVLPKAQ